MIRFSFVWFLCDAIVHVTASTLLWFLHSFFFALLLSVYFDTYEFSAIVSCPPYYYYLPNKETSFSTWEESSVLPLLFSFYFGSYGPFITMGVCGGYTKEVSLFFFHLNL